MLRDKEKTWRHIFFSQCNLVKGFSYPFINAKKNPLSSKSSSLQLFRHQFPQRRFWGFLLSEYKIKLWIDSERFGLVHLL